MNTLDVTTLDVQPTEITIVIEGGIVSVIKAGQAVPKTVCLRVTERVGDTRRLTTYRGPGDAEGNPWRSISVYQMDGDGPCGRLLKPVRKDGV